MSQKKRVQAALEAAKGPVALYQIALAIRQKFKRIDSETAISARIREIRRELELNGKTIASRRAGEGKAHHVYWVARLNP